MNGLKNGARNGLKNRHKIIIGLDMNRNWELKHIEKKNLLCNENITISAIDRDCFKNDVKIIRFFS